MEFISEDPSVLNTEKDLIQYCKDTGTVLFAARGSIPVPPEGSIISAPGDPVFIRSITSGSPQADRPHIVVFLADDHGYLESEPYCADIVKTPNLKRLASQIGCGDPDHVSK